MRTRALLLVVTAGFLVAAGAQDDAVKKEKDKLMGTWKLVSVLKGGKPAEEDKVKSSTFLITADKITVDDGNRKEMAGYKIDPSQKPKTIDLTPETGGDKGEVIPAIYELDGDMLKICFNRPGSKERPKEFKSPEGSNTGLVTLKRDKK